MNFADIILSNTTQVFNYISKKGREEKALAAIFIPNSNIRAKNCALCRSNAWEMWVDHLPITGYAHSSITEDYLKKVFIFKHPCLEYEKAYFARKDKRLIYVEFDSRTAKYCEVIAVEDFGFRREFEIRLQSTNETRTIFGEGYGKKWVFLDPEE